MKRAITLCLIIFTATVTNAQALLPPAFEIRSDTIIDHTLPAVYWQVMTDKKQDWSIDQLKSPAGDRNFRTASGQSTEIDYSIQVYWIRFTLVNKLTRHLTISLSNLNSAAKSAFFIYNKRTGWTTQVTGLFYPYAKRSGLKDLNIIPVELEPNDTVQIYNRISNNYFVTKPKELSAGFGILGNLLEARHNSVAKFHRTELLYELFEGIYFFGLVLNFLFFIIIRERIFLYYAIFLGYLFSWCSVWPNVIFVNHLALYNYVLALLAPAGIIFYILFLRQFLLTSITKPKWDKALFAMCIFLGAENILSFFVKPRIDFDSYDGLLHAEELFHLIGLFMILATLLSSRQRKDRPIRLLLLSGLPVVIWETVIQLPLSVWGYLEEHYAIEKPPFIRVLDKNYETVNGMLMAWLALVFCWMLFQRFLNLQKETARQALEKERIQKEKETELREFIEQQNIELEKKVELRTSALKQTLEDLKATQMQLIQSEKMASLGELTAGIAHEIQNPLNFVNNFSEVNKELADELTSELATGNTQLANDIAGDIKINSDKINFHGRRADSIVKSMLQHSRTGSGVKELTDLNALADEHLRLAYHGFRAKEKGFNTKLETNFDSSIGKIAIIPQEIARVLLNLFNNALYAVTEKQKLQQANFEPTVAVRTQKINGGVEIRVQDNGTGIPIDMVGRIFQPFFTSKPTGQGTGLGLSLAYDIVKAHGGEIKVETKEGEGSCFFIVLSQ